MNWKNRATWFNVAWILWLISLPLPALHTGGAWRPGLLCLRDSLVLPLHVSEENASVIMLFAMANAAIMGSMVVAPLTKRARKTRLLSLTVLPAIGLGLAMAVVPEEIFAGSIGPGWAAWWLGLVCWFIACWIRPQPPAKRYR